MKTYIVKEGDTLYGISKQFGVSVEELKKSNNLIDENISVGSELKIVDDATIKYVVESGDNLYSIASTYNTTVAELKKLNNLSSNLLDVGQVLQIPGKITYDELNYVLYTVKSGDSLYSIANNYNVSVDVLVNYNNLNSNALIIGQVIKIPDGKAKEENSLPDYTVYVVKKGDDMYEIASRYKITVDDIIKDNNLNSTDLAIGQKLLIKNNNILECYGEEYIESTNITYIVLKDDDIYSIANKFNTTVEQIKNKNNLQSLDVTPGQKLII